MQRIRIFLASPGDVAEERDVASHVVDELRRIISGFIDVDLETVRWETHAFPDVGEDAQDVINREIGEFDIFVGIMWRRFGTPTKRGQSGTAEEFERAFALHKKHGVPRIMFYFRTTPFYSTDTKELRQFQMVIAFQNKLRKAGVLYWEYDTPLQFERFMREHILRQLLQNGSTPVPSPQPAKKTPKRPGFGAVPFAHRKALPIFFSYSHADADRVAKFAATLRLAGFPTWIDQDQLLPGQNWFEKVGRAIDNARLAIVFLSRDAVSRPGAFLMETQDMLADRNKQGQDSIKVFVVKLEEVQTPNHLRQYVSFLAYQEDGYSALLDRLDSIAIEEYGKSRG